MMDIDGESTDVHVASLSDLCRLCGDVDNECVELFGDTGIEEELVAKIENAVRITVSEDDTLPKGICTACREKLLGYSAFYQHCHETQEKLQDFFSIQSAVWQCDDTSQLVSAEEEKDADDYADEEELVYYEQEGYMEEDDANTVAVHPSRESESEDVDQNGTLAPVEGADHLENETEVNVHPRCLRTSNSGLPPEDRNIPLLHVDAIREISSDDSQLGNSLESCHKTLRQEYSYSGCLEKGPIALLDASMLGLNVCDNSLGAESVSSASGFRKEMDVLLSSREMEPNEAPLQHNSDSAKDTLPNSPQCPSYSLQEEPLLQLGEYVLGEDNCETGNNSVSRNENNPSNKASVSGSSLSLSDMKAPKLMSNVLLSPLGNLTAEKSLKPVSLGKGELVEINSTAESELGETLTLYAASDGSPSTAGKSTFDELHTSAPIAHKNQNDPDIVLSVDAGVIGASGVIKFQRKVSTMKILIPPSVKLEDMGYEDFMKLFSLDEVRSSCQVQNEGDIIEQLINQGDGRDSVASDTELEFPNALRSPASACDSWSWEISHLLDDEDFGQSRCDGTGDGDVRSELNTPVISFHDSLFDIRDKSDVCSDRSELNTPVIMFPEDVSSSGKRDNQGFDSNRSGLNTPVVTFLASPGVQGSQEGDTPEFTSAFHLSHEDQNNINSFVPPVKSVCAPSEMSCVQLGGNVEPEKTSNSFSETFSSRLNPLPNSASQVLGPLQVQIPEEGDSGEKSSRTLHSTNTFFEELSLGISPVLDLDPNVATVRVASTPCDENINTQLKIDRCLTVQPTPTETVNRVSESCVEMSYGDEENKEADADPADDIKEVAIDIIISNGARQLKHLIKDPRDDYIRGKSCRICNKKFQWRFQAQRHISSHISFKPFICAVCGQNFSVKYYLTRHYKDCHDEISKLKCRFCERVFSRKDRLQEHELSHKGPATLQCNECGKLYHSKVAFIRHVSAYHGEARTFVCDMCGKVFLSKSALTHHMARHDEKKHLCTHCGAAYVNLFELRRHMRKHAIISQHICSFCSLSFDSAANLKRHIRRCPSVSKEVSK